MKLLNVFKRFYKPVSNNNGNGGIGVFGLLGVLFVGLKLGGVISWSWLWVLAPFWGGFALYLIVLFFLIFISLLR